MKQKEAIVRENKEPIRSFNIIRKFLNSEQWTNVNVCTYCLVSGASRHMGIHSHYIFGFDRPSNMPILN